MDTESIVRRIIELKKKSVQLKQSTQDPQSTSNDLLHSILQFGKQMSHSQAARSLKQPDVHSSSKVQELRQSKKNGDITNALFKVFQNSGKSENQNNSELQQSQFAGESSVVTGKIWQQPLTIPQQINYLKQHNSDLEEEIKNLKQKLKRLEDIQKQQREQEWKDGLPYFVLNIPKLRIFYTKLTITEKDYDKIDYSYYTANLLLQKVVLNQLPQIGLSSRPPKSITLMLQDLKEVIYYSKKSSPQKPVFGFSLTQKIKQKQEEQQNLIIFQFKAQKVQAKAKNKNGKKSAFARLKSEDKIKEEQDEIIQTLFMKFQTSEQMKQWDLAIFINFKIMEDLNKADFKAESYNSMSSSTITYEDPNKKQGEKTNFQFRQLMDSFNNKKNKNEGKLNDISKQQQNSDLQRSERSEKKSITLQKLHSNTEQLLNESPPAKKDNNNIKIRDELDSPRHFNKQEHIQQQIPKKQRSDTSHFGGINSGPLSQQKLKQIEEDRIKAEEVRRQKLIQLEQAKRKEAERIQAMKKMQQQLSLKKAKQSLRKGYLMTKFAKSAFHPYQKKVYLSQDGKRLCWIDISSPGDPKFIEISSISSINQGIIGVGVQAHMDVKKIQKKGCFVMINLDSKDRKSLDLSTRDELTMEEFCKDLELYRKSLKER